MNKISYEVSDEMIEAIKKSLGAGHNKEERLQLIEQTPEYSNEEWPSIIPLSGYAVPSFPVGCLPDWLQRYVIELSEATQTPIDLPCMLVLSVVAAAVARKVEIMPHEGWHEPVNIYSVVALPPASRKSAVFSEVTLPIVEYEKALRQSKAAEVRVAQNEYKALEQALQQAQSAKAKALASGKELERDTIRELSEKLENFELPAMPRLLADDATLEQLACLLAEQGGRMAIMSAEGDLFDILAGRYNANSGVNLGVVLKGHSGDFLRVDRIGRGSVSVDNPALTIGLAVQPDVLRGLVQKPGFRGRGLLGRFLFSLPANNIGRRRINARPLSDVTRKRYCDKTESLLDIPLLDSVHVLLLDDAAKEEFIAFETWLEPELAEGGELANIADWAGKLAGAVARIAALIHMADNADNPRPWEQRVTADTIKRAIEIGRYLIEHAKAAFDVMGGNEDLEAAKYLLERITYKGYQKFSKRQIFRDTQSHFGKAENMLPAINILSERGYIRELAPVFTEKAKKPTTYFEVNPIIIDGNTHDINDINDVNTKTNNKVNNVIKVNHISGLDLLAGEI